MGNLMKQAQKLQEQAAAISDELSRQEFTASSGGGMVRATVMGSKVLKELKINPEAADPADIDLLADLIVAAVNEAMKLADDTAAQRMGSLTGGMRLPGLM